jgi:hypothetical protein
MNLRAKSIEAKKKRLLAESVKFQQRIDIMRKRRAQFFAADVKQLDHDRLVLLEEYQQYVDKKQKIKLHPLMGEQKFIKKKVLYRSSSTEALLRSKDTAAYNNYFPHDAIPKPLLPMPKLDEDSVHLET